MQQHKTFIPYNLSIAGTGQDIKKGDKVRTAAGNIETVERVNSWGNVETKESQYSWGKHNLIKIN